jgi:hypothetical protein
MTNADLFLQFIRARDQARVYKELGMPREMVADPILRECRFCNVNREHDAVTVWIKDHLRDPFASFDRTFMVTNLVIARCFNEPSCLEWIIPTPLEELHVTTATLNKLKAEGKKLFRGAYMMPTHGKDTKGVSASDDWMRVAKSVSQMSFEGDQYLGDVADKLMTVMGLGEFLANQICTDLRYVDGYEWKDYDHFILCGPGTKRGLDRYTEEQNPTGTNRTQREYQILLRSIRDDISDKVPKIFNDWFRDPNNLSNCFCEFDKYMRAREQLASGKTKSTLRKYENKSTSLDA